MRLLPVHFDWKRSRITLNHRETHLMGRAPERKIAGRDGAARTAPGAHQIWGNGPRPPATEWRMKVVRVVLERPVADRRIVAGRGEHPLLYTFRNGD
ncbi:MAG: hypothetical protein DME22_17605 [Verrucomicrobia bacterium]|nr:MAG: hypothetical protein DME22_17605 [Verrucomicrobiota bacterium]PYK00678.1 MAG: hypothetical protein DME23_06505 [Verrucomicrobiota bacterium]